MNPGGDGSDTADTLGNLARTTEGGANLLGFLAGIFRAEISADLLGKMQQPEFMAALAEAGGDLGDCLSGKSDEELLDELSLEFTSLFSGPGEHFSPHESVQMDGGSGDLWGTETVEVRRFIENAGFAYKEDFMGLPDHISVEMEFLAQIMTEEASAWRKRDRARAGACLKIEKAFLEAHLGKWSGAFLSRVAARAEHAFYKQVAAMAADFIAAEQVDVERRLGLAAHPD